MRENKQDFEKNRSNHIENAVKMYGRENLC